jgi:hypothetical protein
MHNLAMHTGIHTPTKNGAQINKNAIVSLENPLSRAQTFSQIFISDRCISDDLALFNTWSRISSNLSCIRIHTAFFNTLSRNSSNLNRIRIDTLLFFRYRCLRVRILLSLCSQFFTRVVLLGRCDGGLDGEQLRCCSSVVSRSSCWFSLLLLLIWSLYVTVGVLSNGADTLELLGSGRYKQHKFQDTSSR